MSNVLFINLKRNGDIFNTAALAQSYLKEHPHATPYILTYDEFKKATKPLAVFKGAFTIDRKKITTFHNHNLYSNGFALDELLEELNGLESISWSEIINYSSDRASTFLCNYLASSAGAKVKGIHFGDSNNINYQSSWEVLFNEVMTTSLASPVHFSTAYHGIADVEPFNGPFNIKTISKHNDTVTNNFSNLKRNNTDGTAVSLIGIQLTSSLSNKDWNHENLCSFLELVVEDKSLTPLILIAPTNEERILSKSLNQKFDNKLIIIESDFLALSSVLRGLDLLVTPDTSVKHLADLNGCKIIECSNDLHTTLKQGPRGVGNLVLNKATNDPELIYNSIKFILNPSELTIEAILDKEIYITYNDNLGWNLRPVSGHFTKELFIRQLKRSYIASWCKVSFSWDIKAYFSDYTYSEVQSIIDEEKAQVSTISRDLLGTLRSLVKAADNPSEAAGFVTSLDKLLDHCESESIAAIGVIEFKALLENLKKTNRQEQLRSAEDLLYKLKKNLQLALDCLNTVEKDARSMPIGNKDKANFSFREINA